MTGWIPIVAFLVVYILLTNGFCRSSAFPLEGPEVAPSLGVKRLRNRFRQTSNFSGEILSRQVPRVRPSPPDVAI